MGNPTRKTGLLLVIIGATLWGVGGTVAQKLFQEYSINVNWLVSVRLLIAGFLLLTIHFLSQSRSQIFTIWKNRKTAIQLLIFGLFGMLAVQYTYMASINHGNAAVATLLQYLAPVMIIIYFVLRHRTLPTRRELVTVALALVGCFFLLTNGSVSELSVSLPAIIWGILSGIALAFYTLYAVPLLAQYDSIVVVGWAMLIGGVALSFSHPPWQVDVTNFSLSVWFYVIFVILFGTMIAFWFYIESLQNLLPQEASLLGSLEPLSAVLTTILWLHEPYGPFQWIGTACIIGMTLLLVLKKDTAENINSRGPI